MAQQPDTKTIRLGYMRFPAKRVYVVRETGELGLDMARAGANIWLSFWRDGKWSGSQAFHRDHVLCCGKPSTLWGW